MHQAVMNHDEITASGQGRAKIKTRNDGISGLDLGGVGDAAPRSGGARRWCRWRCATAKAAWSPRARSAPPPARTPAAAPRTASSSSVRRSRLRSTGATSTSRSSAAARRAAVGQGARPCRAAATCTSRTCSPAPTRRYRLRVRVITETAWHSLFARNMFLRPAADELAGLRARLHGRCSCRACEAEPGAATAPARRPRSWSISSARTVLICGTRYAGEIKKSIFTVLNYLLPDAGVLPMHCSANVGPDGDVAIFFGLSGHRQDDAVGRSRRAR